MTGRALLRRASGLVLAGVTGLLGLTVAAPAAHAASETEPSTIAVQITNVSPTVLRPGDDLDVDVTLRNDGSETVKHPRANLLISRWNLASRSQLTAWSEHGVSGAATRQLTSVNAPAALDPGQTVSLHLTVPPESILLRDTPDVWGPRGIAVEASDGSDVLGLQRTFLLWQPTQTGTVPHVDLSVLVPVVGPATGSADTQPAGSTSVDPATADRLQQLTASGGRLDDVLGLLSDPAMHGVGAAVDPHLIAQAHAAGGTAAQWSSALSSALGQRDVVTLPWADADASAIVHGGRPDLLAAAVTRSDAASLPGHRVGTMLWPPSAPDRATAGLVPQLNLQSLVVPAGDPAASQAASHALAPVQSAPTDAGDARLLVADPVLTALMTDPTSVESGATTATATQRLLAELAVLAPRRSGTTAALIAPDRDWQPDPTLVSSELEAVTEAPWSRIAPVSSLRDSKAESGTVARLTANHGELEPVQVQALDDARQRAVAYSGVTADPDTVVDAALDSLLPPLAVAWRADPVGRDELVGSAVAGISTKTTGLSIAPLSNINVISASSEIRVTVHNALDVDATVHLQVAPRKACLQAVNPAPFTIPAHSEKGVVVQLHAAANCEVTVTARLTSPTGLDVAQPVLFSARVAPTIENVGTIVVGILLAIGLVLGIVRTVRRGQSARRGARLEAEANAPLVLAPLGGVAASDPSTSSAGDEAPGAAVARAAAAPPDTRDEG
jgi:hypothetical protein